jgi:hypothetical protein
MPERPHILSVPRAALAHRFPYYLGFIGILCVEDHAATSPEAPQVGSTSSAARDTAGGTPLPMT